MIDKEEVLEVEDKIEKALQKDKEAKEAKEIAGKKGTSKEKENKKAEGNDTKNEVKGDSPEPPKGTKMESSKSIVTPPPSIEKTKDNSKML